MRAAALALGGLCAAAACGRSHDAAKAGRVGASIALLRDGRLAVANPDQGSVSFVDASSLNTLATISVGGDPTQLIQLQSGALLVATHRGGQVAKLDVSTNSVASSAATCTGPSALAESPDGKWVALVCEWSGELLKLDPSTLTTSALATGLHRPRGVAIVGSSAVVAEFVGSDVVEVKADGTRSQISLVPSQATYRPALTQMTANLAAAVVPAFDHLFVPHELVNHTGDASDEAVADDYGTVLNGTPKINAAVTRLALDGEVASAPSDTPPVYSRFDAPSHAFSGAVAAAAFGDRFLLVAHVSTNDVAVLDTTATDPSQRLVASYSVGAGPSGIAVDDANHVAFVDNALDGSISRIDLTASRDSSAPLHTAELTAVRGLTSPLSADAQAGRRLFYDATNAHVTPSRVVACASCHPGGSDDGLVWFMHTASIPLKRRRTPNLCNAHRETAPFHWDGQFASVDDLVHATITGLMGGDGLLVDGAQVQAYLDEAVLPPPAPSADAASIARGHDLFNSAAAGCATCHAGDALTDGLEHAVLDPASLTSDDAFTSANTPALHGLFFRAPFFHDGRSPDLHDLLTRADAHAHGDVSSLSPSDLDDLATYLESL